MKHLTQHPAHGRVPDTCQLSLLQKLGFRETWGLSQQPGFWALQARSPLTLNNDVHSLRRHVEGPDHPPAEVGAVVLACCPWDVEVRILMRKLPASAVLEILDLVNRDVLPAVAPQRDGVPLLDHPATGLELQPGWKTQSTGPRGLEISVKPCEGTLASRPADSTQPGSPSYELSLGKSLRACVRTQATPGPSV